MIKMFSISTINPAHKGAAMMLSVALATLVPARPAEAANVVEGIAAVVNGKVITQSEVRGAVDAQTQMIRAMIPDPAEQQRQIRTLREEALDSLIDRELVLAEFEKSGGRIRPEFLRDDVNRIVVEQYDGDRSAFIAALADAGLTLNKFTELREKQMVVQYMRSQQSRNIPPPTPREVEEYYKKNAADYREPGRINISTITLPKYGGDPGTTTETQRALAEDIRARVQAGASFAELAQRHSSDSRAADGGSWGWVDRSTMNPRIYEIAQSLQPGSVSGLIEDAAAFILIRLDARQDGALKPLDEVRQNIEMRITSEKRQEIEQRWLQRLRDRATIRKLG